MSFLWVTLHVTDLNKSIEFYEGMAGLKVSRRFKPAAVMELAFLSDGKNQTQVELISNAAAPAAAVGEDYSIGFDVDSVEDMMARAKEKEIPVVSEVLSPVPGTTFFYVLDPDGRRVQFVEIR